MYFMCLCAFLALKTPLQTIIAKNAHYVNALCVYRPYRPAAQGGGPQPPHAPPGAGSGD